MFDSPYGIDSRFIGKARDKVFCPNCDSEEFCEIFIYSTYLRRLGMPMFPTGKDIDIVCENCGLERTNQKFNDVLGENLSEIEEKFDHPISLYSGLLISIISILIVFSLMLAG